MDASGSSVVQRKPSLFAQRMKNAKEAKTKKLQEKNDVGPAVSGPECFGEKSIIVTGPEADQIHKENIMKLAAMTKEEIEAERNKLLSEMDPKLIEFLRARKNKPVIPSSIKKCVTENNPEESSSDKIPCTNETEGKMETETVSDTVAYEMSKQWPNMGDLEREKVEWMEELPKPKPPKPDEPYNARFSFDGTLLPFVDEKMDVRQGLHHHGEEPERPGYTIQELIQLSRSSVLQQRIIALNTLANVLQKANLYTECFDQPLLPMLLDAELFLMLRFSLDDACRPVVSASLAALCNLLVNHTDEMCLDELLGCRGGLYQPSLAPSLDLQQTEIDELKDPELLRLDVIRGALRTHLLPRFRYILDKMNPQPIEIVHIMKCLIRIARHSYDAAVAIISCPGLLDSVRATLAKNNVTFYPDSLKLFRILSCQSENLAGHLMEKYSIMEVVLQIIAGEIKENQPEAMRLMLEAFYMWHTLIDYKLAIEQISAFVPVLSRLLCVHIEQTGLVSSVGDLEHAVALLSTLGTAFKANFSQLKSLIPIVLQATEKWTSQMTSVNYLNRNMCKLVGAALTCIGIAVDIEKFYSRLEMHLGLYFQGSLFTEVLSLMRKYSWLLSDDVDKYKNNAAENLPSLAAVPPYFDSQCTLPLIEGLALFVLAVADKRLSDSFLRNPVWEDYLKTFVKKETLGQISRHWFAKQEIRLVCVLLLINHESQTLDCTLVHHAALVLSTIVHTKESKILAKVFQRTIFNEQHFAKHTVSLSAQIEDLQLGNATKKSSLLRDGVNNLAEIKKCYEIQLGFVKNVAPANCRSHNGLLTLSAPKKECEPALPSDWQFLPILRLYNVEGKGNDVVHVATCSLQWIFLLEHFQPDFANRTPITARFSRLCCLFMAGNDLFRDVGNLLKELLQTLMSKGQDLDLDGHVPGLNSFYDFYRLLVDQYVAVSYGDPVFGQYILTPLQQRYNVKYRKLVWSEQAPLVRVLSTPIDQLVIPLRAFLEPCETDVDLLATYLQFLATERVRPQWSPVLFKVAVHHVSTFIIEYPEHNFAKLLKQRIESLGNQALRTLLLEYPRFSENM